MVIQNKLLMGNGQDLEIKRVGNTLIHSFICPRYVLMLKSSFSCCSTISKSTLGNNVVAEFNDTHCLIKDKQMGTIVLQGLLEDGLYKLQVPFQIPSHWILCAQPARFRSVPQASSHVLNIVQVTGNNNLCTLSFVHSPIGVVGSNNGCIVNVTTTNNNYASSAVDNSSDNNSSFCWDDVSCSTKVEGHNGETSVSSKACIDLKILHRFLGHASSLVIKKVDSLYKPTMSINKDSIFCNACQYGKRSYVN